MEKKRGRKSVKERIKPKGKLRPQSRDIAVLQELHYFGPLPQPYPFELTRRFVTRHDDGYQYFTRRMSKLYDHGYLNFHEDQDDPTAARHYIWTLSGKAERLLKERGLWNDLVPSHGGWFEHQVLVACAVASLKINTLGTAIRFIHSHEILAEAGFQAADGIKLSFTVELPETGETAELEPDSLCAYEYADGKRRYFIVEGDRGNEVSGLDRQGELTEERKKHFEQRQKYDRKSILENVYKYRDFIGRKDQQGRSKYVKALRLKPNSEDRYPGMLVLNFTTSATRSDLMIRVAEKASSVGRNAIFCVRSVEGFKKPFRPSFPINMDAPFSRAGHPPFYINSPGS